MIKENRQCWYIKKWLEEGDVTGSHQKFINILLEQALCCAK